MIESKNRSKDSYHCGMKDLVKRIIGDQAWRRLGQARQEFNYRRIKDFSSPEISEHLQKLLGFENGFYVEVGANDGRSYSNTYLLEKTKNWSGILIEPILHKHFESKFYRDSKRNQFVYGACVDFEYSDPFVKMYYSDLMTTSDLGIGQDWANLGGKFLRQGESVMPFGSPALVLSNVLEQRGITKVDFLSIDVEGAEFSVLSGINFNKVEIDIILIESNEDSSAIKYLTGMNYTHILNLGDNHFFRRTLAPITNIA